MIEEFSLPDSSSTIHERHASGPVAYMVWSAETPHNSYRFATDTIYVINSRILYQTSAAIRQRSGERQPGWSRAAIG